MMKRSPKKTMAAYVAEGEVERRGAPPRPMTATGGAARASTRAGSAIATRPGSAPSSAGASPIKGIARRVHPSALASPVRATAAGAAASKKADDERRREEGRRSMRERASAERAERQGSREPAKVVKAKVVTRHAPPSAAQSHAVTALWDKIAGACEGVSVALDECARAMVEPDPNRGTPGFGAGPAVGSSSAPGVSGTTRRKNASRASLKLREARSTFNGFAAGFDELRRHSAALAAALHRSETSAGTVTEQLASTAGYAEETTNRLRKTAREKEVAEMTAREAKTALQTALARIEVLEKERRDVDGYEARLEEADYARANFSKALERAEKAETSAARHKEGVAKLTADNMVFLMRLKETETEIAALRKETADARIELEAKRGAWFDRARKDVERVVQRAIKRAEEADAALEAEFGRQEQKAEEYAKELAKIDDVRAENELLAMAAAKAQKAAEQALMEKVKIHEELQRWKTKEFDATSSAKASTTAAAEAYEHAGVLRKELAETKAELEGMRAFVDAARAEAEAKTRALANQQAVNAGVMRMKNAMEWRVLEMQAALEKAGAAPPPSSRPSDGGSSTDLRWTGVGLPPTPASHAPVPPVAPTHASHPTPSNAGNEIRTIPGFELSPLPQSDLKDATPRLAAADDEQTDDGVHRSAAPPESYSDAASFARFRAMFPDLQTPEEMDDLAALDALDVAGAPALATSAKLSGDATPPPKASRRVSRKRAANAQTDPSIDEAPASTAAPLIAKGNGHASYGATAPAGPVGLLSGVSGPKSPTRGPEVRQTKKSAAAAAANRAMYASVESVKSLADDEARARAIDAAKAARSTPPTSPAKATSTHAADEKADAEFDAFLRDIDEDASGSDHPYQPLASASSSDGEEASDRVLRAPPNPWAGDPRAAEGAAASPGPDYPPLGAMTLGTTSAFRSREKRSPKTSPAKGVPDAKGPRPPSSAATRAGASFKASMAAAAAAAAAGAVKDSGQTAGGHGGPSDADEISADALEDELRRNAREDEEILRAFQASARADERRAAAETATQLAGADRRRGGIRAEFLGGDEDGDDGHDIVGEDVFERAAARAMANKDTGSPSRRAPASSESASHQSAFDGPGWIGAGAGVDSSSIGGFGPMGPRSNSAHTSVLAVDGSSDEEQERERIAAGRPTRVPAFDDDDTTDPDSTDADSIYDVFKTAPGPTPGQAGRREATLSRFASASNPGLDEEHAAAMERLMATGGGGIGGRDAARSLASAADDDDVDLPGGGGGTGGTGFTFSNALPGSGRVAGGENNTGTSVDRPATARGRSRGGVSFSNALPQIR